MKNRLFAASGSCLNETMVIEGKVKNDITFISDEFTATQDSQEFWTKLSEFASSKNKFIELRY